MPIDMLLEPSSYPERPLNPGERLTPIQVAIDAETVKDLISAQLMLTQSMAELAESIRVLAEALGEPEAGEESMVMSRR